MKAIWLLALVLLGCGGGAVNEPRERLDATLEDGTPLGPELAPVRLARVEVDGATVDFLQVWAQAEQVLEGASEDADPQQWSIMMRTRLEVGSPTDPVAEVYNSLDVPATTAELYLALRGPVGWEILPPELAESHFREAAQLNRTSEFLKAWRKPLDQLRGPLVTEKAQFADGFVQVTDSSVSPNIPGRHWVEVQGGASAFVCQAHDSRFFCTAPAPDPMTLFACSHRQSFNEVGYYGLPVEASCKERLVKGWIRNAVASQFNTASLAGAAPTAQLWYGPVTAGRWVAFPAETLPERQWFIHDWNLNSNHATAWALSHAITGQRTAWFQTGMSVAN